MLELHIEQHAKWNLAHLESDSLVKTGDVKHMTKSVTTKVDNFILHQFSEISNVLFANFSDVKVWLNTLEWCQCF